MAKGSGTTRSVGSGSAGSSRTSSSNTVMNFTPRQFFNITGSHMENTTIESVQESLGFIKNIPDNDRLFTGYTAKTVRDVLNTRLNQLKEVDNTLKWITGSNSPGSIRNAMDRATEARENGKITRDEEKRIISAGQKRIESLLRR